MERSARLVHRRTLLGGAAGLALAALAVACSGSSDDPEAAVRTGFEAWAKNVQVAYRTPSYKTVSRQGAFADVVVTAEFQDSAASPWLEREATAHTVKQGDTWQQPSDFRFLPTSRGAQTAQAVANATGTVRAQQANATADVVKQIEQATATQRTQDAQATGTAAVQATATRVVIARATGTAGAQSTATIVAAGQATSTANAQSTATSIAIATRDAPTATPLPKPGTVLYQADWSAGMAGWGAPADWKVVNGMLVNDGSNENYSVNKMALSPFDPKGNPNCAVEAEMQGSDYTAVFGGFGIVVRVANGRGYSGQVGPVFQHGVQAGLCDLATPLTSATNSPPLAQKPFSPGTAWHIYRMEITTNRLSFSIDGAPFLEATDNKYLTAGYIGLFCVGAQLQVRRFKIIAA